jgi:SET domain-containing protein
MNTYIDFRPIKGKCVFAVKDFYKNQHIETNHIIPFRHLDKNWGDLDAYRMAWTKNKDCISLGHINLMNHSSKPNITLERDTNDNVIRAYAKKKIKKGEELTYHYACRLWFKPVD